MVYRKVLFRLSDSIILRYAAICGSFCCGICFGFCYFADCSAYLALFINRGVFVPASFIGLFGAYLPIVVALLHYTLFQRPCMLLLACLFDGFLSALVTFRCFNAIDRGAWLVSLCMLFTSYCSSFLTLVISFRVFAHRRAFDGRCFIGCCLAMVLFVLFHYFCLQPYLLAVI